MATKTLVNKTTSSTTVKTTTTVAGVTSEKSVNTPKPATVNAFFSLGETAFFSYNGLTLPVIVTGFHTTNAATKDGDEVVYTVSGDITALAYPAGITRGPFVNVPANKLSSR